jgi:hypothetical protein
MASAGRSSSDTFASSYGSSRQCEEDKSEVDFLLSPTMNYSSRFIAWT